MRVAQLMQCTMMTDERPAFGLPHHLLCNGRDFALSARYPQYYWEGVYKAPSLWFAPWPDYYEQYMAGRLGPNDRAMHTNRPRDDAMLLKTATELWAIGICHG